MTIKIAEVVSTFPPYRAGQGNVAAAQARVLADRGHDVTVFTSSGDLDPGRDVAGGARVRRLRAIASVGNAPVLPGLARLHGFDVVHVHAPFIFGADMVALRAATTGMPVVMSYHNQLVASGAKGAAFQAYLKTSLALRLRQASKVAMLSRDHALSVPQLAHELMRRPRAFHEVPNGVDPAVFRPGPQSPERARWGIGGDRFVVAMCATLDAAHRTKRPDVAIRATAQLARRLPVDLVLIGDGPLKDDLAQLAVRLGVADHVRFVGALEPADVASCLRAADALVLPSEIEAFGLVLIEAMACGLPVVGPDTPGARVVVREGLDGFKIPPGDPARLAAALQTLHAVGRDGRRAMGDRGRARVLERYTWDRSVDALEECLSRAVETRGALAPV